MNNISLFPPSAVLKAIKCCRGGSFYFTLSSHTHSDLLLYLHVLSGLIHITTFPFAPPSSSPHPYNSFTSSLSFFHHPHCCSLSCFFSLSSASYPPLRLLSLLPTFHLLEVKRLADIGGKYIVGITPASANVVAGVSHRPNYHRTSQGFLLSRWSANK